MLDDVGCDAGGLLVVERSWMKVLRWWGMLTWQVSDFRGRLNTAETFYLVALNSNSKSLIVHNPHKFWPRWVPISMDFHHLVWFFWSLQVKRCHGSVYPSIFMECMEIWYCAWLNEFSLSKFLLLYSIIYPLFKVWNSVLKPPQPEWYLAPGGFSPLS